MLLLQVHEQINDILLYSKTELKLLFLFHWPHPIGAFQEQ